MCVQASIMIHLPAEHQGRIDAFPLLVVKYHQLPIANFDRPYKSVENWAESVNLVKKKSIWKSPIEIDVQAFFFFFKEKFHQ